MTSSPQGCRSLPPVPDWMSPVQPPATREDVAALVDRDVRVLLRQFIAAFKEANLRLVESRQLTINIKERCEDREQPR